MIFPKLQNEEVVQVDDKTRLNAETTYITKDEAPLTVLEIEPEAAAGFISVFDAKEKNWFLDYQYATDGIKVVTVRADNGSGPVTASFNLTIITDVDDKLYSSDKDLIELKTDILKWVPDGRSSYLNMHRKAQELIIAYFDEVGLVDVNQNKLTKASVVDITEVKEWAINLVMWLIFNDLRNSTGDVFKEDRDFYWSQQLKHRDRAVIRLDFNNDGEITNSTETAGMKSLELVRR